MNFYIRTNFSNKLGIGHIIRTTRLSQRLSRLGHTCIFFLDKNNVNNFSFLQKVKAQTLYKNNNNFKNETEDAKLFIEFTKKFSKGNVIVDDYRLTYKWEKLVRKHHLKIIAFDDLEKKHYADVIINSKINDVTKNSFIKNILCFKLLIIGCKYFIIFMIGDKFPPPPT